MKIYFNNITSSKAKSGIIIKPKEKDDPFRCPLLKHVIEKDIEQRQFIELVKDFHLRQQKYKETSEERLFFQKHDRGWEIQNRKLYLIGRDKLLEELSAAMIEGKDTVEIEKQIMDKYGVRPYVIRDPLYNREIPPIVDPMQIFYTGETPLVMVGPIVDPQHYFQVTLYVDPYDPKAQKRALKHAEESYKRACKKMKKMKNLKFLYSLQEETFYKYIRWYDLHIYEMLSFRMIAYIEKYKNYPEFQMNLKKVRTPVKGEDHVEKGVKLIYEAIHRKTYRQKARSFEEVYACPEHHNNQCPANCEHLKKWEVIFNRAYSPDKGYTPDIFFEYHEIKDKRKKYEEYESGHEDFENEDLS
jgi:hypothetical protein